MILVPSRWGFWGPVVLLAGCLSVAPIPDAGPFKTSGEVDAFLKQNFIPETRVVVEGRGRVEGRGSVRFLLFHDRKRGTRFEMHPPFGEAIGALVVAERSWAWIGRGEHHFGTLAGTSGRFGEYGWHRDPSGAWQLWRPGAVLHLSPRTMLPDELAWEQGHLWFHDYRAHGNGYLPFRVRGSLTIETRAPVFFDLRVDRVYFPPELFPAETFRLPRDGMMSSGDPR